MEGAATGTVDAAGVPLDGPATDAFGDPARDAKGDTSERSGSRIYEGDNFYKLE